MEKAVAYSRSLYEIASQTQDEFGKIFEAQFAEVNKNVANVLDKAAKNAPAGSDVAVAAVKSAIAAANVAAATSATVKAVAAAPKAKKAA
jgi:hypothetical protein